MTNLIGHIYAESAQMSCMLTRKRQALNNRNREESEPVFDYACKMTSQTRGYLLGVGCLSPQVCVEVQASHALATAWASSMALTGYRLRECGLT
jgi:hypothetical protein